MKDWTAALLPAASASCSDLSSLAHTDILAVCSWKINSFCLIAQSAGDHGGELPTASQHTRHSQIAAAGS